MKQIGVIPSGVQKWNDSVIAISKRYFVYCSTLSAYVYDLNTFVLTKILTGHLSTITGVTISPFDDNLLATCSNDQTIRIWDISTGRLVKLISTTSGTTGFKPKSIDWSPYNKFEIMTSGLKGLIRVYSYQTGKFRKISVKSERTGYIVKYNPRIKERAIVSLGGGNSYEIVVFDPITTKKKEVIQKKFSKISEKIVDIQLDPLSNNYFIVIFENGEMCLFDSDAPMSYFKVKTFQKTKVNTLCWVKESPGDFYTGDSRSGVVRLWNVSQEMPKKIIKLRKSGIKKMVFNKYDYSQIIISFTDGAVGIYNHKFEKFDYLSEPGHIETIFGCAYCSHNPNIFATSSYDSRVKLWDTRTYKCIGDLIGIPSDSLDTTVIIYSLSWHPNQNLLAGSMGNGFVWIWDVDKNYPKNKYKLHNDCVFKVKWSNLNPELLASTSKDKLCIVFNAEDGNKVKTYKHPQVVFGLDWSPNNKNILATGCHDGLIRIFNISSESNAPITVLKGHTSKVYNVKWNPIVPDTIASGSNDYTVRIWNTKTSDSVVLKGHTNNVRALAWNYEIPSLLLSGSWDGTIRVWNSRTRKCICTIADHHADVYGIDSHPSRPFVYGSTSRDTTIRFWTLENLLEKLYLEIILKGEFGSVVDKGVPKVFSEVEENEVVYKFYGVKSSEIMKKLGESKNVYEKYVTIINFLFNGSENLMNLLGEISGNDSGIEKNSQYSYEEEILHSKIIEKKLKEKVEILKQEKESSGSIGTRQVGEINKDLINTYLQLGEVKNMCELFFETGEYMKALSLAPGVSMEYWKELTERFIMMENNKNRSQNAPHFLAANFLTELMEFHSLRNENTTAFNIGVCSNGKEVDEGCEKKIKRKLSLQRELDLVTNLQSDKFQRRSNPLSSSCCNLRNNKFSQGIRSLLRGSELFLGFVVALCLKRESSESTELYVRLIRKCLKFKLWDCVKILFNSRAILNNVKVKMRVVAQSECCGLTEKELDDLRIIAGVEKPEFYIQEAEKLVSSGGSKSDIVKFYALGKDHNKAAEIAFSNLKELFSPNNEDWDWELIEKMNKAMSFINCSKVEENTLKLSILCFSNFIGAHLAIWKGYTEIAPFLITNSRLLMKGSKNETDLISLEYIDYLLCLSFSFVKPQEAKNYINQVLEGENVKSENIKSALGSLKEKIEKNEIILPKKNKVIPTASILPNRRIGGSRISSFISGDECHGKIIDLGKGKFLTEAEAIMWREICAFSPLNDGAFFEY